MGRILEQGLGLSREGSSVRKASNREAGEVNTSRSFAQELPRALRCQLTLCSWGGAGASISLHLRELLPEVSAPATSRVCPGRRTLCKAEISLI